MLWLSDLYWYVSLEPQLDPGLLDVDIVLRYISEHYGFETDRKGGGWMDGWRDRFKKKSFFLGKKRLFSPNNELPTYQLCFC